jgi:hypothetical protein
MAGCPLTKIGDDIDSEELSFISGPRCASVACVNVHANASIPAHDRMQLERLCRYAARAEPGLLYFHHGLLGVRPRISLQRYNL